MFGSKKSELPPRPGTPTPEQIQEDLGCIRIDDVLLQIITQDEEPQNDSEDIHKRFISFLTVKQQLEVMETQVREISGQLQREKEEILKIAENIEEQAKIALLT